MAAGTYPNRRLRGMLLKGLLVSAAAAAGVVLGATAASAEDGPLGGAVQDTTATMHSAASDAASGPAASLVKTTSSAATPTTEKPQQSHATEDAGPAADAPAQHAATGTQQAAREVTQTDAVATGDDFAKASPPENLTDTGTAPTRTVRDSADTATQAATDTATSTTRTLTDTVTHGTNTLVRAAETTANVTGGVTAPVTDTTRDLTRDLTGDLTGDLSSVVTDTTRDLTGDLTRDLSSVVTGRESVAPGYATDPSPASGAPASDMAFGTVGQVDSPSLADSALASHSGIRGGVGGEYGTPSRVEAASSDLLQTLVSSTAPWDLTTEEATELGVGDGGHVPAPVSPWGVPAPGAGSSPTGGGQGSSGSSIFWLLLAVAASAVVLRNGGLSQLAAGTSAVLSGRAALVQDRPG